MGIQPPKVGPDRPEVVRWETGSACAILGKAPNRGGARVSAVPDHASASSQDEPPQQASPEKMSAESAAGLDIADVPAVEVVLTLAMHLLTASAVACGLATNDDGSPREADLAEARVLINALAALVTASTPDLGSMHAAPLRDGLSAVQRAFREASSIPDHPGEGPGERWTGPIT